MRLHHLEITAFGPFADTVEVDLDRLSSAGLFLLCGDTGAGKTSVLDAICFALYGDVPGDRGDARRLRCDVAPPDRAPRVRLECTLAERRFRITRSPAWQRPKKRGSGLTPQQASVLVEESHGSSAQSWEALTTRMDEAGHLIGGLVGMNITQFCQVVMLPQGRFQAFLRATSEERHQLLQHLFSTRRFEDIERWIREHARDLRRSSDQQAQVARGIVHRIDEVTEGAAPDKLLSQADEVEEWLSGLTSASEALLEETAQQVKESEQSLKNASRARDDGHRLADRAARRDQARETLSTLSTEVAQHEQRVAELDAAHRAAPLRPLHDLLSARAEAFDRAQQTATQAHKRAKQALDPIAFLAAGQDLGSTRSNEADLAFWDEKIRTELASIESLKPSVQQAEALRQRLARERTAVSANQTELATVRARIATHPTALADLTARRDAAADAAEQVTPLKERQREISNLISLHGRLDKLASDLIEHRDSARLQHDEVLQIKDRLLEVREQRIAGMAAEIAGALAVGAPCPVCGSDAHPHKAELAPGTPDASDEKRLAKELASAEAVKQAHDDTVRSLETTIAGIRGQAGDTNLTVLQDQHSTLAAEVAATEQVAETAATLAADLDARQIAANRDGELAETLAHQVATGAATVEALTDQLATLDESVATRLSDSGHATLDDLAQSLAKAHRAITDARESSHRVSNSRQLMLDARAGLDTALLEHDFDDVDEVLGAMRPPELMREIAALVTSHETRQSNAEAVLNEPAIVELGESAAPELAALDRAFETAQGLHREANTQRHRAVHRHERVEALIVELREALNEWAPLQEQHRMAADLAAFVEGKSTDNEFRIRLSAYVLAWRLTQVVDAANDRLGPMTGQRYSLEHSGQRGTGETRGGLSLLVRDVWSGERRDPATLSGGETFVVSLALALGLSDVVAGEAGGQELDTLFVDEGFGTLDPDTLDDVMGILDGLREGGRVVGVVSHVAELRTRISTRLDVHKDRAGSSLAICVDHEVR